MLLTQLRYRYALSPAGATVSVLFLFRATPQIHLHVAPKLQEQYAIDEAYRHSSHCEKKEAKRERIVRGGICVP